MIPAYGVPDDNTAQPTPPPPGLLSRISAAIQDKLFSGAAPDSLTGLLSPDDIRAARKHSMTHLGLSLLAASSGAPGKPAMNALAAIGQAGLGAQEQYGQDVQSDVTGQQNAMQMAQSKRLAALRSRLGTQYPQPPNETPDQQMQRIEQLAIEYANGGDPDTAGKLAQLAKAIRENRQVGKPTAVQYGTGVTTFDPTALGGKGGFYDPTANNGQGGYSPSIQRGVDPDTEKDKALDRSLRGAQIDEAKYALSQRQLQQISSAFDHSVTPLTQHLTSLQQTEGLLQEAQTNPSAWGPAVSNFIQATDAKPQLRFQLLEFLGNQIGGPSLVQRVQLMLDKGITGTFDPRIAKAMQSVLDREKQSTLGQYESRRQGLLSRHKDIPGLEDWLTPSSDVYQSPNGAVDLYNKYGIKPPSQ